MAQQEAEWHPHGHSYGKWGRGFIKAVRENGIAGGQINSESREEESERQGGETVVRKRRALPALRGRINPLSRFEVVFKKHLLTFQ